MISPETVGQWQSGAGIEGMYVCANLGYKLDREF